MCFVNLTPGRKTIIIFLLVLLSITSKVHSKCGCHRVPGQGGIFSTNRHHAAINHNFESLPQTIQPSSDGNGESMQYSVPNFRVLLFQPTFLDFREQPVGMPYVQSVLLANPSDQNDIEVTAIHALPPFHSSRFHRQVLRPKTNMSIDIVFLATMIGNVEHTVYIYTSKGNFPYQVFGIGKPNPYRLRSFVSARIPINGTFSPYINMYNPHSETIQSKYAVNILSFYTRRMVQDLLELNEVVSDREMFQISEMYSSGNDLHLDVLSQPDKSEVYGKLWEIPPYETKAVMKATFYPKEDGINIRFIRIKLGAGAPEDEVLIIPFELLVSKKHSLYTNIDMLDFGTLRTMDDPKLLNLNALNNGNKTLKILSIQVVPPNKAVTVNFTNHNGVSLNYLVIGDTSRQWKFIDKANHALHKRQNTGKIVVYTSEDTKKMEVPYQANILHGTLAYSVGKTSFFVGDSPTTQVLTITNTFNSTLVIYNATLPTEAMEVFKIKNFTKAIMVPPGKLISPLSISFQTNESDLSLSTVLRLYTNASIFTIPVHCYNGKLKYQVESINDGVLDYGTVGTLENRTLTFKIVNRNPVEVSIKEYGTEFEYARLRLLHIKSVKSAKSTSKRNKWSKERFCSEKSSCSLRDQNKSKEDSKQEESKEILLRPSDIATFVLDITAPKKEGTYQSDIVMHTQYEVIRIPIYLKTVQGSLLSKPKKIRIDKAFPGRTENYPLSLESTFEYSISLQNLSIYPEDSRFAFIKPDFLPQLPPKEKTHIGWVKFDPFYGEASQCYLCICEIDAACEHWYQSLTLSADTWELDFNLLEKLRRKWDSVEAKHESSFNASIIVDSSVIKSYTIPVQASLAWPTLVEQSIKFPPTHVGNYSMEEIIITNPSDHPLVVQVVPLLNYPQPDGGLDLLSDRLIMDSFSLELNGHSSFYIPEIKDGTQDHGCISSALNIHPSHNSISLLLEPRQKKVVSVGFMPDDEKSKTSIMVVRNNLTILDLVMVQGQGAQTNFNINGNAPGGKSSVLLFEIKPVHLKDCNKSTPKARVYPSFTVKRSFTAENMGQLPVHVVSMNINSYECEGYGFRILNCESFILMPNTTRKIDITFIPDFTTSRVTRTLRFVTTMGQSLEFVLLATLPHHMLPLCADALPRPFWEPYLHVVAAIVMSTVFIFIIFFAYFDAQKYVVQCTFTAGSTTGSSMTKDLDSYTHGTVFDLKAIAGVKVRITDKKEKYNHENKSASRATKTSTISSTTKSNSTTANIKNGDPVSRTRTNSDSSSNSSRRNSSTFVPEEKPEPKMAKEPTDTPKRTKQRRTYDSNRSTPRTNVNAETPEPVIVMEEIRDPWDRDLMEKARLDRQRIKVNNTDESRNRKKSKTGAKKEQTHRNLQKENSNSTGEDERVDEKPSGFTTVESKGRVKKKAELTQSNSYPITGGTSHLDKLDEISLSGPRPDVKEQQRKNTKNENKQKHRKKVPHDKERLVMDTPTSPHAIAAAIVDAALQQKKKKNRGSKGETSPSSPTSPAGLSSRSSSYSSIISDVAKNGDIGRSYSPRGGQEESSSPSNSNRNSPKHRPYEELETSPRKGKKEIGWGSYLRKLGINIGREDKAEDQIIANGNSMFYYDNLSTLRASKQPVPEDDCRAPGSKPRKQNVTNSTLSPDSAEFIPASLRNKAPGSNMKKDTSWAADDSVIENLRPPPGFTRPARSIWGEDSKLAKNRDTDDFWSENKSSLFDFQSAFKSEGSYSSLLGRMDRSSDVFSSLNLLSSRAGRDDTTSLWKPSSDNDFVVGIEKDLWNGDSSNVISAIWDTPDPLHPPTSSGNTTARSRLGLDLDLKPVNDNGLSDADSPLDPFALWASTAGPNSPYEGWNQDIKEE